MNSILFSEFLEEQSKFLHPYYKASSEFKSKLEKFDSHIHSILIGRIQEFKNLKTLNPQDLIRSGNWKDHSLHGALSDYYETHLIHGQISLIYYHGGRYILLMDIVQHKILTTAAAGNVEASKLGAMIGPLKKYVENKLSIWDKNNQ